MKKVLLMIFTLAFLLVGCGNQQETNTPSTEQPTTTESTTTNVPTSTPTEAPTTTEEPTEPPHEHTYTESTTKEASCTEAGEKTFTCECGDTYTEAIEATGHNYEAVADSEVSATCTNDGKEADTKCSLCDDVITGAVIPATGHSYVDYVYNNDATYEADGTETATCSTCGDKTTRTKAGTKLEPENHWYDGYAKHIWHDMGEYMFWIGNTQEEADNALGPSDELSQALATLHERYPDRKVYLASNTRDGISFAFMSTNKENPFWRPTFIWE